jgi:hypothetical protein
LHFDNCAGIKIKLPTLLFAKMQKHETLYIFCISMNKNVGNFLLMSALLLAHILIIAHIPHHLR